ncbi:glycosyltransferase family 4 protein [Cyclobacterium xiamenense]|uniref:glycosyltransferase family 4 protein n=1 Tax=Cyclobacterium xiamenense TaxID=1297121 RepID=UPI0012B823CE|nr:glycosyltransferase family 4 protein [Cyclobacterium xiamenense]
MQEKKITALYVTNMYPTPEHPVDGIFIQEQIEDLAKTLPLAPEIALIDSVYQGKKEYLKSIIAIPKRIRSKAYDIIHVHYGLSGLFLLFYKPKAKVLLTLHGSDIQKRENNAWQVWLTKKILPKADQVFVQNQAMKDLVLPHNRQVSVLTCGVDTAFFRPEAPPESTGNSRLILFPSSPSREVKNYPLFQEVIRRIREKVAYDVEFACIDQLSRTEVRSLLSKADCLLLTSKTEGSPQVVKEALCCNLPVVAVPVGDVKQIIAGVPNCRVAGSHDADELAHLTIQCLQEKRENIRDAFLRNQKYQHREIAETMARHYLQAVQKESPNNQLIPSTETVS